MNKRTKRTASLVLLTIMATAIATLANAEQIIREFHGTGNTVTSEFEVDGPWLLDWRLNGEYETMMAIDIMLMDGRTGRLEGQVLHTKRPGNGVKLFNNSGRFKLRIDSTLAKWDIKVIQITAAEAELYTPRKDNPQ